MRTICRLTSPLLLVRNLMDDAWILCRRRPDGTLVNLASSPTTLAINPSAILQDGHGNPDLFLDAAIAADRATPPPVGTVRVTDTATGRRAEIPWAAYTETTDAPTLATVDHALRHAAIAFVAASAAHHFHIERA